MNLHEHPDEFRELQGIVADYIGIPEGAVKRDYFIVKMLQQLAASPYADICVFKGGTSLSKCYPGSIERFSEDIDLSVILPKEASSNLYSKKLKQVEKSIAENFQLEKIIGERNDRNKSAHVWFDKQDTDNGSIKLEIGSSVRPDPYRSMIIRTYIQEYLEAKGMQDDIAEFELHEVEINALAIERTFLDKVMAVKRHAICGTLKNKIRHIYDVTMLFQREDIQKFLYASQDLKQLLQLTKETDSFYLQKRGIVEAYNPTGAYDFPSWRKYFDDAARRRYESLHEDLLYTDKKQKFIQAIQTFEQLNQIFSDIEE